MKVKLTSLEFLIITQALSYMSMDGDVDDEDRKLSYDIFCKMQNEFKKSRNQIGPEQLMKVEVEE